MCCVAHRPRLTSRVGSPLYSCRPCGPPAGPLAVATVASNFFTVELNVSATTNIPPLTVTFLGADGTVVKAFTFSLTSV